ncbi:MAG TPA: cation acetate symporter [Tepidisphaeraceae bacterium]|nr:cation acetate symporter [Tepidisphaeraceae bacterium]
MNYTASSTAIVVFIAFVGFVLGISFYLGRKARSAQGYFAAHGEIGWFVNGVAFAGDYLSAASFLGICGMIAFYGYDGFLYSIGYLAGWIVALFVIAEPIKRLGRYTFADALNAKFNSRGIQVAAAISTLVVSIFYLIPQMVGAGALCKPLLGWPHWVGVVLVGIVVLVIVVTAGMVSTTWVQFIKGSLLVIFCAALTVAILARGFRVTATADQIKPVAATQPSDIPFGGQVVSIGGGPDERDLGAGTGPLGPLEFFTRINDVRVVQWTGKADPANPGTTIYTPSEKPVSDYMVPGGSPTFKGIRSPNLADRLDFVSLMLALFAGTASLPHILIRYYTVKDAAAARKSTVVGIGSIGFFYILTLYLGLGAMTSGRLDPTRAGSNMAAPLLAKTFGELPFAIISAIAFTTVLGTVSGLIMAASGAVAHDLMENVFKHHANENAKVGAAKWAALGVGIIAIVLGTIFESFNVTFLVGWAFNVAASANLPALVMLLFWKRTTRAGIIWAIWVGMLSSLAWLMLSAPAFADIYKLDPTRAPAPFSQPGLVTIPLGFVVLVVVSLMTRDERTLAPAAQPA